MNYRKRTHDLDGLTKGVWVEAAGTLEPSTNTEVMRTGWFTSYDLPANEAAPESCTITDGDGNQTVLYNFKIISE